MIPMRLWRRSRWLFSMAAFFLLIVLGWPALAALRPHSNVEALAPVIVAFAAGIVVGILVATDVLTRSVDNR